MLDWTHSANARYPTCLVYLTLLGTPSFRAMLGDMGFIGELARIGTRHHETWLVLIAVVRN